MLRLWFVRPWLLDHPARRFIGIIAVIASPVVLFFSIDATLAELEEVVVLKTTNAQGHFAAPIEEMIWPRAR